MTQNNPVVDVKNVENAVIVTLTYDEFTTNGHVTTLEESIMPLIREREKTNLILDFTHVDFVSSSLLGFLLKLKQQVQQSHGQLKLCGIGSQVKNSPNDKYINELFKIVKLDTVFEIYDTADRALHSLS